MEQNSAEQNSAVQSLPKENGLVLQIPHQTVVKQTKLNQV